MNHGHFEQGSPLRSPRGGVLRTRCRCQHDCQQWQKDTQQLLSHFVSPRGTSQFLFPCLSSHRNLWSTVPMPRTSSVGLYTAGVVIFLVTSRVNCFPRWSCTVSLKMMESPVDPYDVAVKNGIVFPEEIGFIEGVHHYCDHPVVGFHNAFESNLIDRQAPFAHAAARTRHRLIDHRANERIPLPRSGYGSLRRCIRGGVTGLLHGYTRLGCRTSRSCWLVVRTASVISSTTPPTCSLQAQLRVRSTPYLSLKAI